LERIVLDTIILRVDGGKINSPRGDLPSCLAAKLRRLGGGRGADAASNEGKIRKFQFRFQE
jgi:hypothetical protein